MSGDEPRDADLLLQGAERATLSERVWGLVNTASQHARRRPLGVVLVAGAVAAVAVVAAYVAMRPPGLDPVVHVTLGGTLTRPDDRGALALQDHEPEALTGMYALLAEVPGDSVQLLGIVGPGLRDPLGSTRETTPEHSISVNVRSTVDCSQEGWWTAEAAAYQALLRRTDADDRVVDYKAPLADAADWRDTVRSLCLRDAVAGMTVWQGTTDASPGHQAAQVRLSIRNPYPAPIWLEMPDLGSGSVSQQVPAEGSGELTLPVLVMDCTQRDAWVPWNQDEASGSTYLFARADVEPLTPAQGGPDDPRSVALPIDGQLARSLTVKMRATCRGAPHVRATIAGVHRTGGEALALGWAIDLRVAVRADQLAFGVRQIQPDDPVDRSDYAGDDSTLQLSTPVDVRDGVAQATITWTLASCSLADETPPPGLYVVAVEGDRRYPTWVPLDDRALLAALRTACDGSPTAQQALGNGWPS